MSSSAPSTPRTEKRRERDQPSPASKGRPATTAPTAKHSSWRQMPRDRYLVLILNIFLLVACLSFIIIQQTRTDLPSLHPAGGTIKEKAEDEEGEEEEQVVEGPDGQQISYDDDGTEPFQAEVIEEADGGTDV